MGIFVDNLVKNKNKELCSSDFIAHLFCDDNEEELHQFAEKYLNIKDKQWFDERADRRHYDIDSNEYYLALKNGAKI